MALSDRVLRAILDAFVMEFSIESKRALTLCTPIFASGLGVRARLKIAGPRKRGSKGPALGHDRQDRLRGSWFPPPAVTRTRVIIVANGGRGGGRDTFISAGERGVRGSPVRTHARTHVRTHASSCRVQNGWSLKLACEMWREVMA